eukprot:XP_011672817.1 PREDICTED: uncharacterized protein LOC105442425 [Strongylocentrotus purpuratus]
MDLEYGCGAISRTIGTWIVALHKLSARSSTPVPNLTSPHGLKVSPPDFMRPRRGRKKQLVEESDSEDEEWKPKRAKKKSRGTFSTPFKAPAVKSNKPVITKKQPEPKPHTVTSGTVYDDDGNPLNDAHHIGGERIIDLLEWKDYDESTQPQTNPTASSGDQGNQSGDPNTQSGDQKTEQTLTGVATIGDPTPKQTRSFCMKEKGETPPIPQTI